MIPHTELLALLEKATPTAQARYRELMKEGYSCAFFTEESVFMEAHPKFNPDITFGERIDLK